VNGEDFLRLAGRQISSQILSVILAGEQHQLLFILLQYYFY
jgi:hypothetical protein